MSGERIVQGQAVELTVGGARRYATVDEYEAESDLYSVKLVGSGKCRLAADDELETIDLAAL